MPTATSTDDRPLDGLVLLRRRAETFGLEDDDPWALDALRLLADVPRLYQPLVDALARRRPALVPALDRLVADGWVAHQGPVIADTVTGQTHERPGRAVTRYRLTASGMRLRDDAHDDVRNLEDHHPRLTPRNAAGVIALLDVLASTGRSAQLGLSAAACCQAVTALPDRTVRWWLSRLCDAGHAARLPTKAPDVREVVPAHWRMTRALRDQLVDVVDLLDSAGDHLAVELRLHRRKYLGEIEPSRVGAFGATDFDHDVMAQRLLGALLASPRAVDDAAFAVEPRFALPVDRTARPWAFADGGDHTALYLPDAELRERRPDGRLVRSVVEYERAQARRDAWSHIERFLGWLHTHTLSAEAGVLRFIVDSPARQRAYVELIEAFADHLLDHPDWLPDNPAVLAVSTVEQVLAAPDPLSERVWFRIDLQQLVSRADTAPGPRSPRLHHPKRSPYDEYFAPAARPRGPGG